MKNLEEYGVKSLSAQESDAIIGGFWQELGYAVGYVVGSVVDMAGEVAAHFTGVNPNT